MYHLGAVREFAVSVQDKAQGLAHGGSRFYSKGLSVDRGNREGFGMTNAASVKHKGGAREWLPRLQAGRT